MRAPLFLPAFGVLMICLMAFIQPWGHALASQNEEYQVKAAFIYNFTNYIEWPARAFPAVSTPFTICVMGKNPFGNSFDSLAGETVRGRRVMVRHIYRIEEAADCHLLFISDSERRNVPQILRFLRGRPVLTIGDYRGFCQDGGMINLLMVKRRVRFDIQPAAARKVGIHIGAQLMALAREVME